MAAACAGQCRLQAYVTGVDGPALLRGLRLFGFVAGRYYYDEPSDGDAEDTDVQVGADYYFDNIPGTKSIWASAVFANAGYRKTAFALEDYEAFTVFGNVKTGPKWTRNSMILFPYGVADWSYSPTYDERWWGELRARWRRPCWVSLLPFRGAGHRLVGRFGAGGGGSTCLSRGCPRSRIWATRHRIAWKTQTYARAWRSPRVGSTAKPQRRVGETFVCPAVGVSAGRSPMDGSRRAGRCGQQPGPAARSLSRPCRGAGTE